MRASARADAANAVCGKWRERGGRATAVQADVRDASAMASVVELIAREHGALDVLVNNAGVIRDNLVLTMESDEWSNVVETNLTGAFNCIKPAAKLMMQRRQGAIVNLSSVAAARPGRGHCNYAASKGGLETLTKALAVELGSRNIRVNAVAPGVVETDMSEELRRAAGEQVLARIPLRRFGAPADVANAVLFLASDQAAYVTGAVLAVDGGLGI